MHLLLLEGRILNIYIPSSLSKEDKLTNFLPLEGGGLRWG